jgi:hypothetical protein
MDLSQAPPHGEGPDFTAEELAALGMRRRTPDDPVPVFRTVDDPLDLGWDELAHLRFVPGRGPTAEAVEREMRRLRRLRGIARMIRREYPEHMTETQQGEFNERIARFAVRLGLPAPPADLLADEIDEARHCKACGLPYTFGDVYMRDAEHIARALADLDPPKARPLAPASRPRPVQPVVVARLPRARERQRSERRVRGAEAIAGSGDGPPPEGDPDPQAAPASPPREHAAAATIGGAA